MHNPRLQMWTSDDQRADRLGQIREFEYFMIAVAALVVTLSVTGEVRDIGYAEIAREAAATAEATPGDPAAEAQGDGQETVNGTAEPDSGDAVSLCARAAWGMPPLSARLDWHLAMLLLRFVRQWVLIPLLTMAIPSMVLALGADAKNVALNSLAVLFLLDLDNMVFKIGLNEKTRTYLEKHARVPLTSAASKLLHRQKVCYLVVVPITVMAGIWTGIDWGPEFGFVIPFMVSTFLASILDSLLCVTLAGSCAERAAIALKWLPLKTLPSMVLVMFLTQMTNYYSHVEGVGN